jgi:hypothetical protein
MALVGIIKHAPFRTRSIKIEVDELPGKLPFVLFQFLNVRRQTQSASRGIVWRLVFSAHVDQSKMETVSVLKQQQTSSKGAPILL